MDSAALPIGFLEQHLCSKHRARVEEDGKCLDVLSSGLPTFKLVSGTLSDVSRFETSTKIGELFSGGVVEGN